MLPKLKARTAPKSKTSALPPPKTVEEISAYIERTNTESEKRLAGYLTQVKEVCGAVKPGEMPDIPEFMQRKRPGRLMADDPRLPFRASPPASRHHGGVTDDGIRQSSWSAECRAELRPVLRRTSA